MRNLSTYGIDCYPLTDLPLSFAPLLTAITGDYIQLTEENVPVFPLLPGPLRQLTVPLSIDLLPGYGLCPGHCPIGKGDIKVPKVLSLADL